MSWQSWTTIGAWVLVTAVAIAAHLFGREARTNRAACRDDREVRRARLGVAVSITGPLLVLLIGLIIAAITGLWAPVGLATIAVIIVVAAVGLYLAPS